jgi:hypothetical protein
MIFDPDYDRQLHHENQMIRFIQRKQACNMFKKYNSTELLTPYEKLGFVVNDDYKYNISTIDMDKLIDCTNQHLNNYKSVYKMYSKYTEDLHTIKTNLEQGENNIMDSMKNLLMTIKTDYHRFFLDKHKEFKELIMNNIHTSTIYVNIIHLIDSLIDCCRLFVYYGLIKHKQHIHIPIQNEPYDVISSCKRYKLELYQKYKNNYNREKERKNISLLTKTNLPNDVCKYVISEFL